MLRQKNRRMSGFTLVELAIVLGVAGILFGGLWRLLSTSNQQMRDQAAANQQSQLISAVGTYLQTLEGQTFMAGMASGGNDVLNLPSSLANAAGNASCLTDGNMTGLPRDHRNLCTVLPPGTWSGTTNSYGQTYSIKILKDTSAAGTPPQSYSYMILTIGGDNIPDTSGGRISAMIGGDGGFIYNTPTCGATPANACGSYGTWTVAPAAAGSYVYPAASVTVGHVASRTYYSPLQNVSDYWLARRLVPGDASFTFNTMFAGTTLYLGNNDLVFGTSTVPATNAAVMDVQGGIISLGATGKINLGGPVVAGKLVGRVAAVGDPSLIALTSPNVINLNPLINLTGGCTSNATLGCGPVLQITLGDIVINNGMINSQTFTYSSSDERLKTNIKALADPLANVMKIKPVSFVYKANGKESMGVVAQDLEKIYPQLVITGRDGMKSVGYEGLIGPLIGSVQELKKENDDLRAQLRDQAARQERMEKEIETMRRK